MAIQTSLRGHRGRWGRVITAMVTTFDDQGRVDYQRTADLARWLLQNGSDALVVNGTTGESPTTTVEEKIELVRTIVRAVGSDKVIAGAGGYSTAEAVELANLSHEAGASALLAVTGYYNKPSQEGLYRHFRAVADASPLPIILYNVPSRTIVNLEATTVARLASDAPTIVAIKEASANLAQIGEIIRTTPEDFDVYSGDDGTILPLLSIGGAGVISVISHVAGPQLAQLHEAWFNGDAAGAARAFLPTLPITRALFSAPSPAPTKYALSLVGQPVGSVRLPLVDLTEPEQRLVRTALTQSGLLASAP